MSIKRIAVDDNIFMKTKRATAGSRMLYNFMPPVDSTVVERLKNAGFSDITTTISNEFGISLTGSFGCVDAVASGEADIGIGCDISGAIRKEASKKGVFFIKPTYGTVSRFGLVSTAPSMEQIGVVFKDIDDGFSVLSVISGFDKRDGTLAENEKYSFPATDSDISGLKIAEPGEWEEQLSCFDFVPDVFYTIASAETSNSLARFDGVKFGYRTEKYRNLEDIYKKSRAEGFSFETKLMILSGMRALTKENYEAYNAALFKRGVIKFSTEEAFKCYDALKMPAERAKSEDPFLSFCESYKNLRYSALPNITGCPALAMPGGVQFMAKAQGENTLYKIGKSMQKKEAAR